MLLRNRNSLKEAEWIVITLQTAIMIPSMQLVFFTILTSVAHSLEKLQLNLLEPIWKQVFHIKYIKGLLFSVSYFFFCNVNAIQCINLFYIINHPATH